MSVLKVKHLAFHFSAGKDTNFSVTSKEQGCNFFNLSKQWDRDNKNLAPRFYVLLSND